MRPSLIYPFLGLWATMGWVILETPEDLLQGPSWSRPATDFLCTSTPNAPRYPRYHLIDGSLKASWDYYELYEGSVVGGSFEVHANYPLANQRPKYHLQ